VYDPKPPEAVAPTWEDLVEYGVSSGKASWGWYLTVWDKDRHIVISDKYYGKGQKARDACYAAGQREVAKMEKGANFACGNAPDPK
jgi:hypothetical protein